MNSLPAFRTTTKILLLILLQLLAGSAFRAGAGGVVASADQASLQGALNGGGTVTFSIDGRIILTNAITIGQNTVLDASGHDVTIDGNAAVRLFNVAPGINFTIVKLGLANARPANTNAGGAVYNNSGTLTVIDSFFQSNLITGGTGNSMGGAIYNNGGVLNITNSSFTANTSQGTNGQRGQSTFGGAIYNFGGNVYLEKSLFQDNRSVGGTGFSLSGGPPGLAAGMAGGAAVVNDSGALTIRRTTFLGNSTVAAGATKGSGSDGNGGAIFNTNGALVASASSFLTNKATGGDGIYPYGGGGFGSGGAIFNVAGTTCLLTSNVFLGNAAQGGLSGKAQGGAIFSSSDVTMNTCFFSGNSAEGGRHSNASLGFYIKPGDGDGGAIYTSAIMAFQTCTFGQNQARGGDLPDTTGSFTGGAGNGYGGGLYNLGTVLATNCTFSTNTAKGGDCALSLPAGSAYGGGVFNANSNASITLSFVTLSGNTAVRGNGQTPGSRAGGGIDNSGGTVRLRNSIVANSPSGGNASGGVIDEQFNISSDASCNFTLPGSLNNTDPLLGPLANNGGFAPSIALLPGSPAIDAAPSASTPATDQRGVVRPQFAAPDIGAFEATPRRSPNIYSFSPTNGLPGTVVTIAGTNFFLASQVSFNGATATFSVNSDSQISATAPAGFASGPITVTTYDGSATSTNIFSIASPIPITGTASVSASGATLNGTVVQDGITDTAWFEYGLSTSYGTTSPIQNLGASNGVVAVTAALSGLNHDTVYHFRLVAQNGAVTNYGADRTFTTLTPIVSIATLAATAITNNSADLNGQGSGDGFPANVYFQFGPTTNLGNSTVPQAIGNGTSPVPFSATASGLVAGHVYFFRAVIFNAAITNYGAVMDFATPLSQGADFALSFDGVDDYVEVAHNAGLNAYPFTLTAWFRTVQIDGFVGIAGKSGTGYQISIDDGNLRAFYQGSNSIVTKSINGLNGGFVSDGLWHQAAFTIDASGGKLYLDGVLKDTAPWSSTPSAPTNTVSLKFGPYLDYLNGQLDEISLWNTALSGTQIQTGMTNRLTGAESNLIGYWRFDEGAGLTSADSSGHGNDATLVNGPRWVYSGTPLRKTIGAVANRQANGTIRFTLIGAPGQSFTLQSSTTLTNWIDTLTNVLGADGTFQYLDTNSPVTPKRFLRTSQ